jgi:hypothetical protein
MRPSVVSGREIMCLLDLRKPFRFAPAIWIHPDPSGTNGDTAKAAVRIAAAGCMDALAWCSRLRSRGAILFDLYQGGDEIRRADTLCRWNR